MTRKPTPNILDDVLSANPGKTTPINARGIKIDGGTQMRAGLDDATVDEYADQFRESRNWGHFPPVIVYHDGSDYWLADGFHRVAAWKRSGNAALGLEMIPADVRAGARRDAILHAAGANASHGLRRTNADKRRAVEVLLRDEEWQKWSDAEIARRCEVSQPFVSNLRKQLAASHNDYKMLEERIVTRGGMQYTQNTANIGGKRPTPQSPISQSPNRAYNAGLPALNVPSPSGQRYKSLAEMEADGDLPPATVAPRPSPLATPAGPKLPITDFELTDICETVANEVYGDDLQFLRTYYAMMSSADQQSGEYWEKLLRVLAPFDLAPPRIQQAVHTQAKQMMIERRLTKAQAQDAATPAPVSAPRPSPLAPPAHAPYAPGWQIQQALTGWSKNLAPSELRNLARYRGGAQWFAARQALEGLHYRDRDLVQALNSLADHGAHAAEPQQVETQGVVSAPSHNAFLSDGETAQRKGADAQGEAEGEGEGEGEAEGADIRIGQCSRLINVYRQAIAAETEYGQLTGCFTETLAAKRELEKLIGRLQSTLDLLEGRNVETPEECD